MSEHPRDLAGYRAALQPIVDDLLAEADGSRTTIRVEIPEIGIDMRTPIVEARAPGVGTLLNSVRTDQDKSGTLNYLRREKRILVQPDTENADPGAIPPGQLHEYKIKAQLLAGLFHGETLFGFLSVHEARDVRDWKETDLDALRRAVDRTMAVVDAKP